MASLGGVPLCVCACFASIKLYSRPQFSIFLVDGQIIFVVVLLALAGYIMTSMGSS